MIRPKNVASQDGCPETNLLYVVLHGLICLVDKGDDGFVAYLNEMGSDHAYLCGDFLGEHILDLSPNNYTQYIDLVNVCSGTAKFDTTLNAVVKVDNMPSPSAADVRVAISLPRPKCIHHYIKGDIASGAFTGDTKCLVQIPKQISGIRIFEYLVPDFDDVQLQSGPRYTLWKCAKPVSVYDASKSRWIKLAVLHVYNEPPEEMPHEQAADHNLREFNRTLSYLQANLKLRVPGHVQTTNDPQLLPGLLPEEIVALDRRPDFAGSLVAKLRYLLHFQSELEDLRIQLNTLMKQFDINSRLAENEKSEIKYPISSGLAGTLLGIYDSIHTTGAGGGAGGSQVCGGANAIVGG